MSVRDAIAIVLPDTPDAPPHWVRIVDGAMVQSGQGVNWLDACGLAALPPESQTALIVPGSDITLEGVMLNPLRTGLFKTLKEMGASIEALEQRNEGGEDVADAFLREGADEGSSVGVLGAKRHGRQTHQTEGSDRTKELGAGHHGRPMCGHRGRRSSGAFQRLRYCDRSGFNQSKSSIGGGAPLRISLARIWR